jgi:S1-C subfamily serine protease
MVDISDLLTKTGHWTSEDGKGEILGTGSCWPLKGDLVVTNFHVASLGSKATVEFEYLGVMPVIGLVAVDKPRDLVIAKVRTGKLKLPTFDVSEEFPRVGTDVYVLGSPCGLKQSVSRGIVSAIRSATDLAEFGVKGRKSDRFVQVDAAISQGCSGGPIIDSSGTVIAVSTFFLARGQALNFGVPSAYACDQ